MQTKTVKLLRSINLMTIWILIFSVFTYGNLPSLKAATEQISGVSYFANPGDCVDPEGTDSTYALIMTGDLQGCHYVFVQYARCSPSGTYFESGVETFVGSYGNRFGTFGTTYNFEAKYRDCPNLLGEVVGRCQHPVVRNSGTGDFEGIMGRLDFKDEISTGNFLYRGHLIR